ncbi:MAG: hypothetical protein M3R31_04550, partial [Pseudomonadota bacterium]|nr:hypothetical protein [Pseudomonadota bacterium]
MKPLLDDSVPVADAARFWLACADQGTAASLEVSAHDAQRAIALYRYTHDPRGAYLAWIALSYALTLTGKLDDALHALEEAGKLRDATWPAWLRALLDNDAGLLFAELGQPEKAREHLAEMLT